MENKRPEKIRIGCASAFWGDTDYAAEQLIDTGNLDYLVFDYLSEITLGLLAGARQKNKEAGFVPDFIRVITPLLPKISAQKIKVICNAGGLNVPACQKSLEKLIHENNLSLKVVSITGDDLCSLSSETRANLKSFEKKSHNPQECLSLNAYLGAEPIQKALSLGADIVLTGRIVDSALALGPLLHEFGWDLSDYDSLAAGSLAGHIIECGTQCTGGNFTDWELVSGFDNMGFPIVECYQDGSFIVTKPHNTGGLVNVATVCEQLVYEIGNPTSYILPDVVCDFSEVTVTDVGENRVLVKGAKGRSPTDTYKVVGSFTEGYKAETSFVLGGLAVSGKGKSIAEALLKRVTHLIKSHGFKDFTKTRIAFLGDEPTLDDRLIARTIVVKISVVHAEEAALTLFSREIAGAATSMAPGIAALMGGRPHAAPRLFVTSFLVPKLNVPIWVGEEILKPSKRTPPFSDPHISLKPLEFPSSTRLHPDTQRITVPLIRLAWARSGDKGDSVNIGVIARKAEFLPFIAEQLTESVVKNYFGALVKGTVERWYIPGIRAINFLLQEALDGGGIQSLNSDPQGKTYAQKLLAYPISMPENLL